MWKPTFTPEQDSTLIELRRERVSWPKIANRLGRHPEACRSRFNKLVPNPDDRRITSRLDMWTVEEVQTMERMLADGKSAKDISIFLNRPLYGVRTKIQYQKVAAIRTEIGKVKPHERAPDERIAERDRRLSAHRDLTAIFMGDPPFHYSALGKKLAAEAT